MDFLKSFKKAEEQKQEQEIKQEEQKQEQETKQANLIDTISKLIEEEVAKAKSTEVIALAKNKIAEMEIEKQEVKKNSLELKNHTIQFERDITTISKKLIEDLTQATDKLADGNKLFLQELEKKQVFKRFKEEINESFRNNSDRFITNAENKINSLDISINRLAESIQLYKQATALTIRLLGLFVVIVVGLFLFLYFSNRATKLELENLAYKTDEKVNNIGENITGIHNILQENRKYWYDEKNRIVYMKKEKKKQ